MSKIYETSKIYDGDEKMSTFNAWEKRVNKECNHDWISFSLFIQFIYFINFPSCTSILYAIYEDSIIILHVVGATYIT